MIACHHCGKDLGLAANSQVSRSEECPHCQADVRVCKLCHFYSESAYNECRESIAERVLDKEKANFCDYFKLSADGSTSENQRQSLIDTADALFKN